MTSQLKTFMLLALLSGLIIVLGGALGGKTGIVIAFGLALIMNVGSYWYSDKIVLRMYQARELSESEAPMIYSMVRELAANAQIPMPRIAVVPEEAPNAFATGRNPENSVVAVTEGILRLLSPEELKGVLAHEIAHIANRDILIQTVAGVMASTIVSIANFMQFAAIFGMGRSSEDGEGGGSNPLMAIVLAILAPIAASLIQFRRQRGALLRAAPSPRRRARQAPVMEPAHPHAERQPHHGGNVHRRPPLRRRHGQAVQHPPRHQRPHRPSPRNGGRQIKNLRRAGHCPLPFRGKRSGRLRQGPRILLNSRPRRPSHCISSTSRKKMVPYPAQTGCGTFFAYPRAIRHSLGNKSEGICFFPPLERP